MTLSKFLKEIINGAGFIILIAALYIGFSWYLQRDSYMCPGCHRYINISNTDYVYTNESFYHVNCYEEVMKNGNY